MDLPECEISTERPEPLDSAGRAAGRPRPILPARALIVDDSRFIRDYLNVLLSRRGMACSTAENGQAGLDCLDGSGPYDLALIDWNMPVMNGLEMIQAIRRDRAQSHIKIVVVTAEADNSYIEAALAAGADEYLMKPFDDAGLVSKLEMIGALP